MITSRLPLLFGIAAVLTLGLTGGLFSASPFVIVAQAAAIGLNVWARRSFPQGTFRVTAAPAGDSVMMRGPYRLIRHPMYSSVFIFIWAGVLSHLSLVNACIGIAVTLVVAARIIAEERLLRARFPEYREYARSTKTLIPYVV